MNLAAATNESLAEASNVLIYSSMAVYTLAFFAHIAEWVFGSRSKVGRTAAALSTSSARASAAAPAVKAQAGGTAVLERPEVITRSAAGTRDVPDGPGAAGGTFKGDLYGRIAVSLTVVAFLVEAGGVITRALSVQRAPWANMYEFSITFSTVAVGSYLVLLALKKNVRWIGLPLVTTVLLDLGIAVTTLYTDSDQLVPALHSYWLWIHVSTAILCGAVFYLGAVGTILYLFRDSYENKLASGGTPGKFASSVMERLPSAASAGQVLVPDQRGRLPAVDVHDHRRGDLGGRRLGPVLGLGPQGGLVLHHLGRLRRLSARPRHRRLEGPQGRLPGAPRLRLLAVQLLRREHLRLRPALLRGGLSDPRTTDKAPRTQSRPGAFRMRWCAVRTWAGSCRRGSCRRRDGPAPPRPRPRACGRP